MITLTQLRAFEAVARHRHFTHAAEELQLAQPSVSYQVRELEHQLRVSLVEVVRRKVYLTEAGEHLAARTAVLLNELADMERDLRDRGAGLAGRLRLGASRTVGSYALPGVLAAFRGAHPGIEIELAIDNTQAIERLLLDREVDLAVVEWKMTSRGLVSRTLGHDTLLLVAAPSHPLASRERLTLDDLRGQAFIWRESGSGTRALAEQALGAVAHDLLSAFEVDQPEAIVRLVEAGLGLTFISRVIVARQLSQGSLRELLVEGLSLKRDFSLVQLHGRHHSPAARAFATYLAHAWSA
jgi:DNA-binding transcriptional LysR family regulator